MRKWIDVDYKQFETVNDIKVGLAKWINLSKEFDLAIGYIEPGHGTKGRKRWLHDDSDLIDLYQLYKGRRLCCGASQMLIPRDLDLDLHVVVVRLSHLQAPKPHPK